MAADDSGLLQTYSVLVRVSPLLNKKGATAVAPKHENILSKKLKKLTTTTINKVASLAADGVHRRAVDDQKVSTL